MEDEWSQACVMVSAVLFPGGCASDGDYDACACFADFYGGSVNGGDYCFLVVGFEGDWCAVELQVCWVLLESAELLEGLLI